MPIDEDDDLALRIGRIVMSATALDYTARNVFLTLSDALTDGPRSWDAIQTPDKFSSIVESCVEMIKRHSNLSEVQRGDAIEALVRSEAAYRLRNRAAHDLWSIASPDAVKQWVRQRHPRRGIEYPVSEQRPATEASLHDDLTTLRRSNLELSQLHTVISEANPRWRIVGVSGSGRTWPFDDWEIVRGEFELLSDGSFQRWSTDPARRHGDSGLAE